MEDVLALYEQSYDPLRPVVCFDERPWQLLGDILAPLPMKPGSPMRQDYEYERNGTCCIFLAFDPFRGWRFVQIRARRTARDYAAFMQELVDTHYPGIECMRLVQDNLNTHTPGSFYHAVAPQEAFECAQKFELHYTPRKGSWLNMAEIELAALAKQCLDRRISDVQTLQKETALWTARRNKACKTVHWKFTPSEARSKLKSKYPMLQN